MVIMLCCIIKQRHIFAVGFFNDFFQGLAFETAVLQKIIGGVHIGCMMLIVMKFERLLGKIGLERIIWIGKIGQCKRHLGLLVSFGRLGDAVGRRHGEPIDKRPCAA